jgi:CheY-like chemotaxis protein
MAKIMVAVGETENAELFMMALLPKGHEVYIVEKYPALLLISRQRQPDLIVVDTDVPEFKGIEGLRELRRDPSLAACKAVIFSHDSGLDFVKATMKLGVVGYLYKPTSAGEIREQMDRIIETISIGHSRREFVRVKPARGEKSMVEVFVDREKSVSGSLLDISLGGIAIRLNNPERAGLLESGRQYEKLRLYLEGLTSTELGAEAVVVRGDTAAFRFRGMGDEALRVLCRYIHQRLLGADEKSGGQERMLNMV